VPARSVTAIRHQAANITVHRIHCTTSRTTLALSATGRPNHAYRHQQCNCPMKFAPFVLLLVSATTNAVVVRSDAPDSKYLVPESALPALADLPVEGHGTLIAKRWVVTAAHAVQTMRDMPQQDYVTIAGKRRTVVRIVLYPDYLAHADEWNQLFKRMRTEDAAAWVAQFISIHSQRHDIALLELALPVDDVKPASLYQGSDEPGRTAQIFGKGATGNSLAGAAADAPHRTELRHAYNRIVEAKGQWLYYTFDCSSQALPLEGAAGGGDSGGPVLIQQDGAWKLAGVITGMYGLKTELLAARAGTFRWGICGQTFSNSRISHYARWIEDTIASP
jgi:Trypsin.